MRSPTITPPRDAHTSSPARRVSLSRPSTPSYQASNEHVGQQLQQALSLQGSASPLRGVATEYLTPEQARPVELGDEPPPGRLVSLLVRRPACVVVGVWLVAACAAGLVVGIGGLDFSASEDLFLHADHIDVKRSELSYNLPYASMLNNPDGAAVIDGSGSSRRLSESELSELEVCGAERQPMTFTLVYEARDGGSVLRPALLQEIFVIEARVRAWVRAADACWPSQAATGAPCACALDSLVNYLLPTAVDAPSPAASLRFDGQGLGEVQASWLSPHHPTAPPPPPHPPPPPPPPATPSPHAHVHLHRRSRRPAAPSRAGERRPRLPARADARGRARGAALASRPQRLLQ